MTRRILLTLADDTTATECWSCVMLSSVRADDPRFVEWACNAFTDSPDSMGLVDTAARRLPECIAAEAAAARMVEIAPEDAALRPWVVSGGWTPKHAAAAERIERALEAHGEVEP